LKLKKVILNSGFNAWIKYQNNYWLSKSEQTGQWMEMLMICPTNREMHRHLYNVQIPRSVETDMIWLACFFLKTHGDECVYYVSPK